MAIAIEASDFLHSNNADIHTLPSFTCPAGTTMLVVAGMMTVTNTGYQNADPANATMTYNGVSLVRQVWQDSFSTNRVRYASVWTMLNPPTGSAYDIVQARGGTAPVDNAIGAVALSGVDLTGFGDTDVGELAGTDAFATLSAQNADSILIAAAAGNATNAPIYSVHGSTVEIGSYSSDAQYQEAVGMGYILAGGLGTHEVGFDCNKSITNVWAGLEILPGAAVGVTPKAQFQKVPVGSSDLMQAVIGG